MSISAMTPLGRLLIYTEARARYEYKSISPIERLIHLYRGARYAR